MSTLSIPVTETVVGAVGTTLMLSKAAGVDCASVLPVEERELTEPLPVQQAFFEQSSTFATLAAGFEALLLQQLFLEQSSALATEAPGIGLISLSLQQLFLEQSSTLATDNSVAVCLEQSAFFDNVTSGSTLATTLENRCRSSSS